VPTGKVKWFDAEKGFGFLSQDNGPDVYVRSDALPEGVSTLKTGTRVEFGIAQGRRGDQALQVRVLDAPASVQRNQAHARRKKPEEMVPIVEDLIRLLDGVGEACTGTAGTPTRVRPGLRRSCFARWPTSSSSESPNRYGVPSPPPVR
jgi:cold shock protein